MNFKTAKRIHSITSYHAYDIHYKSNWYRNKQTTFVSKIHCYINEVSNTMILFHQYVYLNAFQCITSPPSMKGTINAVIKWDISIQLDKWDMCTMYWVDQGILDEILWTENYGLQSYDKNSENQHAWNMTMWLQNNRKIKIRTENGSQWLAATVFIIF